MNLISKVKSSDFLGGVFSVGSGNLLAQVIQILTLPVVSRIFTDEMNGEYALVVSTAAIVVTFATLGLTEAVMTAKSDRESCIVFQVALLFSVTIPSVFVFVLLILSPTIQLFTLSVSYQWGLILMLAYMVFVNYSALLYTIINRRKNNKVLMVNPIIGAAMTLLVTIPLGLAGCGSVSMLIALVAAEALKILHMSRHVNPFKPLIHLSDIVLVTKTYRAFILFQSPAYFFQTLSIQMPNQLFSHLFGASSLGNYSMCMRLLEYPSRLIAAPINAVYFRTATGYVRDGKSLSAFTFKLIIILFAALSLPVLIVVLWGPQIFAFILGDGWQNAGNFASILVFPIAIRFCCTCVSYCRVTLGKQKQNMVFCFANLLITIISIGVGFSISHEILFVVGCFAVGLTVMGLFDLGLSFYLMKNDFRKFILVAFCALIFWGFCLLAKGLVL